MESLNGNGSQPAAIAEIRILMLQDGSIHCKAQVQSREIFLMMMEAAKIDTLEALKKQPASPSVLSAPPGFRLPH
jgi:hypothetical protein